MSGSAALATMSTAVVILCTVSAMLIGEAYDSVAFNREAVQFSPQQRHVRGLYKSLQRVLQIVPQRVLHVYRETLQSLPAFFVIIAIASIAISFFRVEGMRKIYFIPHLYIHSFAPRHLHLYQRLHQPNT